jgi:hypothetical protein
MNQTSRFSEQVRKAFEPTGGGVVGLVDALLDLCPEQGLRLDWQAARCRVRPLGAGPHEWIEIPLPKTVFRAVLARMARLCNERIPDSVSPYGGEGELSVGTDPPTVFRVAFANTPGEQRLEVERLGDHANGAAAGDALEASNGPGPMKRSGRIGTR